MSLLRVWSCETKEVVNRMLKALAIALKLEWVFPTKAIEIFEVDTTSTLTRL